MLSTIFVYFEREDLSLFIPESSRWPDPVISETKGKTKEQREKNEILGGGDYQWTKSWNCFIFLPKLFTAFVYTFRKEIMAIRYQYKGRGKRQHPEKKDFFVTLLRRMSAKIRGRDYPAKYNKCVKNSLSTVNYNIFTTRNWL